MSTPSSVSVPARPVSAGRRRLIRAGAVLAAAVAGVACWLVAVPVLDVALFVTTAGSSRLVGAGSVVGAAVVAGSAGWCLLALLERLTRSARRIWTTTAVVVTVLSLLLGPPAAQSPTSAAVLAVLHLVVAAVVVLPLRRSARH